MLLEIEQYYNHQIDSSHYSTHAMENEGLSQRWIHFRVIIFIAHIVLGVLHRFDPNFNLKRTVVKIIISFVGICITARLKSRDYNPDDIGVDDHDHGSDVWHNQDWEYPLNFNLK